MILLSEIQASVDEQKKQILKTDSGITRETLDIVPLSRDFISIISGIRRCGKSTLLQQLMQKAETDYAYFNFEDPRIFGFEVNDFPKLEEALGDCTYFFFDEIQNIEGWELFVRKLHDKGKIICVTGSNASLLSRELGTRLTGRNIQFELFPFNFNEFCRFYGCEKDNKSVVNYLEQGGFPAFLKNPHIPYLQQLFKDILFRDIIARHGVRKSKTIESIALFLISNVGKEYSLNGLKNAFDVGSANSVSDYISWLEDSYLIFSLPRFSWSLKSISKAPKKIYTIDTGFALANSHSFSKDKGRLFENLIYLNLRRTGKEIFYFKEKGECDFIVKEKNTVTQAIQACFELNADNLQREVNGLREAMDFFDLEEGIIVTKSQNDLFITDDKKISVVSADKWLI